MKISIPFNLILNFDNQIVSNFAQHENPEMNFFWRALVPYENLMH